MVKTIGLWIERFGQLKQAGSKMIPQALKDLNNKLKELQQAVYEGNLSKATSGGKSVTREEEARLVESSVKVETKSVKWPQNLFEEHASYIKSKVGDGWPDIAKRAKSGVDDNGNVVFYCNEVAAFSGKITAVTIKGPKKIYRVLHPGKNKKSGAWWFETKPENAKEWREKWAVLDEYNINNYILEYTIPAGIELKAWKGHASTQISEKSGQQLDGGAIQLYFEFPASLRAEINALPAISTGWGNNLGLFGYKFMTDGDHSVNKLSSSETRVK